MERNKFQIDLLDTSFTILVDEDSVYLERLLNRYRGILEKTRNAVGISKDEPIKLAIITGLLLCDEIEKLKSQKNNEDNELEKRTLDLIARIDEAIPPQE